MTASTRRSTVSQSFAEAAARSLLAFTLPDADDHDDDFGVPPFGRLSNDKDKNGPDTFSAMTQNNDTDTDIDELQNEEKAVAASTTSRIRSLQLILVTGLLGSTVAAAIGVFRLTRNDEKSRFRQHVRTQATSIQEAFVLNLEQRFHSLQAMATYITSIAAATNQSFPFVTVPNFVMHGSDVRVQAHSHILHYMPVVYDQDREAWEAYALANRQQIDEAYVTDQEQRQRQDVELGFANSTSTTLSLSDSGSSQQGKRYLQENQTDSDVVKNPTSAEAPDITKLEDGTGYHPRIWSNGFVTPFGDEANGTGPYLPLWQRSPVNDGRQSRLNLNFARSPRLAGVLPYLLETKQAFLNPARISLSAQLGGTTQLVDQNLEYSQFRHSTNIAELSQDSFSYIAYPVMDSFDPNPEVAAVLATPLVWRLLLTNVLQASTSNSFDCVIENSFNQTLTYRVQGPIVRFLGDQDVHDTSFDNHKVTTDSNDFARGMQDPSRQSYMHVPFNTEYGRYTLNIYPTKEAEDIFITNTPWVYACIVLGVATFMMSLFCAFMYLVEHRHRLVMARVIRNAAMATAAERDLNEYLAHEVRNPLASAIVAHGFTTTTLEENPNAIPDETIRNAIVSDQKIVESCLHYVDEFLKSMLLMYRAAANKLEVNQTETNILTKVLSPVRDMLIPMISKGITVSVDCPKDLNVMVDRLRLEQIIMQLCWNAEKFTNQGFIRLKAYTNKEGNVEISVEDCGPGIPTEKRSVIFQKYHTSLQVVSQGNGIGMSLCKGLVGLLGSKIWLDGSYDSGVVGNPGVRFVVDLKKPPLHMGGLAKEAKDESIQGNFEASYSVASPKPSVVEVTNQPTELANGDSVVEENHSKPADSPREFDGSRMLQEDQPSLSEAKIADPAEQTQEADKQESSMNPEQLIPTPAAESTDQLPDTLSVLFIDDDKMLRKLFGRAVRKLCPNWEIKDCACGEDALDLLDGEASMLLKDIENQAAEGVQQRFCRYDIIFIDQYMSSTEPRMLGTELVTTMRNRGIAAVLCGLSANDLGKEFKDAGADFFLCKPLPFKPEPLRQTLLKLFKRAQAGRP